MAQDTATGEGSGGPADAGSRAPLREAAGRFARFKLPALLGLFILSWWASVHFQHEPELPDDDSKPAAEPKKAAVTAANPADLLARGDEALRLHRFALALSHYEELRAASADHVPLIEYRLALCNESIGQLDKAIAGYRNSGSGPYKPALSFACHLGIARCLLRKGEFAETRRLLCPFLLDDARQKDMPRSFLADTRYLIALALSRESLASQPAKSEFISIATVGLEAPVYLDEVGDRTPADRTAKPESTVDDKKQQRGLVVKKKTDNHPLVVIERVHVHRNATDFLTSLAAESGVTIQVSSNAWKMLTDRTVRLSLQNWLLDDLLEPIADYFDLVCRVDGDIRHICTRAEMDANLLKGVQRERGGRALRGALVAYASHPWAAAACLELGNWEAAQGKTAEAAAWYERIIRESQTSPYVSPAHFNLALLHQGKQDMAAARAAFFRVIDHTPGHELALKAYIRVGQSFLEEDDAKEGIVHLRHALATAPHSPHHGHAVVALTAGYLLSDQPDKARTVLAKERALLQTSPCKATAAFLDAYAQFQLAKESSQARREASDLLSTLWRDQDKTVLGPLGDYLLAQAYRDLGFWSHAEQLLRQAGKQARGSLEKAVELSLADTLLQQQNREEGERLLVKLAGTNPPISPGPGCNWPSSASVTSNSRRVPGCVKNCGTNMPRSTAGRC